MSIMTLIESLKDETKSQVAIKNKLLREADMIAEKENENGLAEDYLIEWSGMERDEVHIDDYGDIRAEKGGITESTSPLNDDELISFYKWVLENKS